MAEWREFFKVEPWGATSNEWCAGVIASTVANTSGAEHPDGRAWKPEDFAPSLWPDTDGPGQSAEDMAALARGLAKSLGGKIGSGG